MATIRLQRDFKEFLRLLNAHGVEYLLIGGYAVNYYGFTRSTGDLDVWIERSNVNARRIAEALREFGFGEAAPEMFVEPEQIVRLGVPPFRIEIHTDISGVEFRECHSGRETAEFEGQPVPVLNLDDLKRNKRASGRLKDLADLEALDG
jgi:hypothetical protein